MTPSSEEIAAALEEVIALHGIVGRLDLHREMDPRDVQQIQAVHERLGKAARPLAAHLSRLREEAEFRDAALRFCAEDFAEFHPKEVPDAADRSPYARNARLWFAYRALEEPRDAD